MTVARPVKRPRRIQDLKKEHFARNRKADDALRVYSHLMKLAIPKFFPRQTIVACMTTLRASSLTRQTPLIPKKQVNGAVKTLRNYIDALKLARTELKRGLRTKLSLTWETEETGNLKKESEELDKSIKEIEDLLKKAEKRKKR